MADNVTLSYVGSFHFVSLYNLLDEILKNTTDWYASPFLQPAQLNGKTYFSITQDVCLAATASTRASWGVYEHQDIWNRIVSFFYSAR